MATISMSKKCRKHHFVTRSSRFFKFFQSKGIIEATVRGIKLCRFHLLQGGLELEKTILLMQNNASLQIYEKLHAFVREIDIYVKPKNFQTKVV
mgnify:FL=1